MKIKLASTEKDFVATGLLAITLPDFNFAAAKSRDAIGLHQRGAWRKYNAGKHVEKP